MTIKKTILITGAAARIGKFIATHFAENGWNVGIHYNTSKEAAESLVDELTSKNLSAACFQANLAVEETYLDLAERVHAQFGTLHCLINNASFFEYDSVKTTTRESWNQHLETNLRAPFVLSQAFQAQLPEDIDGNIINILDQRVWNLTPHYTSYTVSKAALWTLTQTMALACAPRIRVNAIGPGPTLANPKQTQHHFDNQCKNVPLEKGPELIEITHAIDFILESSSMTGQMLALDGGQHLGWAFPDQKISEFD